MGNLIPEDRKELEAFAPPWKRLEPEFLCDAKIFTLQKIPSLSPETGKEFDFFRLEAQDWVNVVALTPDNNAILVVQQRHGIDKATLEIPAGLVDPGEEPSRAALRELEEETGYVPEELIHIGTCYPNPAFLTNTCYSYLARNCTPRGTVQQDASEEVKMLLVPEPELHHLLLKGLLGNSMGIVALYWYDLYRRGMPWQGDRNME
ncbi:MAG: NUDIX hydrolase [Vulcanimicrobiota bacterium]